MIRTIIFIIFCFLSLSTYSQTFEENNKEYFNTLKIENEEIISLRVPDKKIKSPAKSQIIMLQKALDDIQNDIKQGKSINSFYTFNVKSSFNSINYKDKNWKLDAYRNELISYEKIVDNRSKNNHIKPTASIFPKEQLKKEDIRFVNIGELTIYSDTSKEAEDVGHLPTYCAVKVIKDLDNGYSQILACDFKNGFVKTKYLVMDKKLITVESEFKVIEHNFCFVIYPDNDKMYYNGYISEKNRVYYVGLKGGCYYLTSNGNKVYVDRNVCN